MAFIGVLIGALLITYLVSRALRRWVFKSLPGLQRSVVPNVVTLAISTVVGAFGFADGGDAKWTSAFLTYLIPTAVWTVVDLIRNKKTVPVAPAASPPTAKSQ